MGQAAAANSDPESLGELMRLLIDECLHTSLIGVAHEAGYVCDHVNFIGLSGYEDWRVPLSWAMRAGWPADRPPSRSQLLQLFLLLDSIAPSGLRRHFL